MFIHREVPSSRKPPLFPYFLVPGHSQEPFLWCLDGGVGAMRHKANIIRSFFLGHDRGDLRGRRERNTRALLVFVY